METRAATRASSRGVIGLAVPCDIARSESRAAPEPYGLAAPRMVDHTPCGAMD